MQFKDSRVYFSPCGMGLGHVSRCVPIAKEVQNRGGEVLFSTYLEGVDYIAKHGLSVVEAPEVYLETDENGSIDMKATVKTRALTVFITVLKQVIFEIKQMQVFKPDVVFSDTRISTIIAARLMRIPCVVLLNQFLPRAPRDKDTNFWKMLDGTVMTVLGRVWTLTHRVIVPDFPEPYTISLDSLRAPKRYGAKMVLVGSILGVRPEDNLDSSKIREELGVSDDQVLVYAGISGPKAERMPLIHMLTPIFKEFPDRFHVVMSTGDPHGGSTPKRIGNLTQIPWIVDRYSYLNACDVVISRGGHETIMQSIGYSKPSLIIPTPRHTEQYGNAERAVENGVAGAMHQKDVSVASLVKRLDHLLGNSSRKILVEMNKNQHLDEGLERTLEIIAEFID
jgi:UDP-N-acetylglucosamine--N-acetylmuramyl-(pentapeptide) pyrophosphoryl-undecaprenol N-acetylglucosamine transferase